MRTGLFPDSMFLTAACTLGFSVIGFYALASRNVLDRWWAFRKYRVKNEIAFVFTRLLHSELVV